MPIRMTPPPAMSCLIPCDLAPGLSLPYPSIRLMTPHTPRPAPIAVTNVCKILTAKNKLKIDKHNMEGIKPPFLVLGTHQSFTDFYVTPLCLAPYRANYISELEGFENFGEWIYRQVGCLGTRKFINDQALIKNIRRVIKRKGIMVIYPEARYANVGTPSEIPLSVAKLVKLLKVPVVTVNMQGNYLMSPIWNLKERKSVKLHADVTCVLKM